MVLKLLSATDLQRAVSAVRNSTEDIQNSVSKLSSGQRVVRAQDDAASLAVGSRIRREVASLEQARANTSQASSLLAVAEGAAARIQENLTRLRVLSVQAGSANLSDSERALLDIEFQALLAEIDRIAKDSRFNGRTLTGGQNILSALDEDFIEGQNGLVNIAFRNFNASPVVSGGDGAFDFSLLYSASGNSASASTPVVQVGVLNSNVNSAFGAAGASNGVGAIVQALQRNIASAGGNTSYDGTAQDDGGVGSDYTLNLFTDDQNIVNGGFSNGAQVAGATALQRAIDSTAGSSSYGGTAQDDAGVGSDYTLDIFTNDQQFTNNVLSAGATTDIGGGQTSIENAGGGSSYGGILVDAGGGNSEYTLDIFSDDVAFNNAGASNGLGAIIQAGQSNVVSTAGDSSYGGLVAQQVVGQSDYTVDISDGNEAFLNAGASNGLGALIQAGISNIQSNDVDTDYQGFVGLNELGESSYDLTFFSDATTTDQTNYAFSFTEPTQVDLTLQGTQRDGGAQITYTGRLDSNSIANFGESDFDATGGTLVTLDNPTTAGTLSDQTRNESEFFFVFGPDYSFNPRPGTAFDVRDYGAVPANANAIVGNLQYRLGDFGGGFVDVNPGEDPPGFDPLVTFATPLSERRESFGLEESEPTQQFDFKVGTGILPTEDNVSLEVQGLTVENLLIQGLDILTRDNADVASRFLDLAREFLIEQRTAIGAKRNQLEFAERNNAQQIVAQEAARSEILDLDVAAEITQLVASSILQQGGLAIISQADQFRRDVFQNLIVQNAVPPV